MIKQRKSFARTRKVNADPAPTLIEAVSVTRFWRLVTVGGEDECWPWQGGSYNGYGQFSYRGHMRPAHELALMFTVGELKPAGFDTCHSCDNPPCCNPHHLRFDTRQSNVDDMWERGRARQGEGHHCSKLTNDSVREMRERRANGARQVDLATYYGISAAYVSDIVNGLCWQDAGGPITGKSKRTKRYPNSRRGKVA